MSEFRSRHWWWWPYGLEVVVGVAVVAWWVYLLLTRGSLGAVPVTAWIFLLGWIVIGAVGLVNVFQELVIDANGVTVARLVGRRHRDWAELRDLRLAPAERSMGAALVALVGLRGWLVLSGAGWRALVRADELAALRASLARAEVRLHDESGGFRG